MTTVATTTSSTGTFTALRHRNFRFYVLGQLISISGLWMQQTAQGWLVFQLTRSELALGLVACAAGVPSLLLSPFGGVIVDRFPRRLVLMVTQSILMTLAFTLAFLVFNNLIEVWHIMLISFLGGLVNCVDAPARQAFIKDMVGPADMSSGITLNSLMANGARVFGPTIAGMLLASVGAAWCFFIGGVSFLGVLTSLFIMAVPNPVPPGVGKGSPLKQMKDGLQYSMQHANILPLLLLSAVTSSFAVNTITLLPAFADVVLHEPVTGLSVLSAVQGLGAVSAGLLLGWLANHFGRGRVASVLSLILSSAMVLLAQTTLLPLSAICMAVFGFSMVLVFVNINTMIQNEVPDAFRGRVMSLFTITFMGLTPFGALGLGLIADYIGTSAGLTVYGIVNGALSLGILLRWRQMWTLN